MKAGLATDIVNFMANIMWAAVENINNEFGPVKIPCGSWEVLSILKSNFKEKKEIPCSVQEEKIHRIMHECYDNIQWTFKYAKGSL